MKKTELSSKLVVDSLIAGEVIKFQVFSQPIELVVRESLVEKSSYLLNLSLQILTRMTKIQKCAHFTQIVNNLGENLRASYPHRRRNANSDGGASARPLLRDQRTASRQL